MQQSALKRHCHSNNNSCSVRSCPWVNNCVGYYNYRYFVNFLFWTCLGCLYGAACMYNPYYKLPLWRRARLTLVNQPKPLLALLFPMAFAVGISVGLLLAFHVYLIATAQTTIEVALFFDIYLIKRRWEVI